MCAVHRVPSLECDDSPPTGIRELRPQLSWREAKGFEIVMARELQTFESSADVPWIAAVHKITDSRMHHARRLEDRLGFGLPIGLPDILDMEDRDHHAFSIAQGDLRASRFQRFGESLSNIERDWHWPEGAVGQVHIFTNTLVIGLVHEARERREAAI